MKYNASELAYWLYTRLPKYGCFSFLEAKRMLYGKGLDEHQAMSVIILAISSGYLEKSHGGATLMRVKNVT